MLAIRPLNDLEAGRPAPGFAGSWRSRSGDPQFGLMPADATLLPGWYRLELRWRLFGGHIEAPVLYPDYGNGPDEATVIALDVRGSDERCSMLLYFSQPVRGLRFDPSTQACEFALDVPVLRPMAAASVARDRFVWMLRHGLPAWSIWTRLRMQSAGDMQQLAESMVRESVLPPVPPPAPPRAVALARNLFNGVIAARAQGESWRTIAGNAFRAFGADGVRGFGGRLHRFVHAPGRGGSADSSYERWIDQEDLAIDAPATGPLISVVVPAYKPPAGFLAAAIDSVLGQTYARFEICVSDDASGDAATLELLRDYAARDPRVRYIVRDERGGIAANTNSALQLAQGDYVVFLDHDDLLQRDALAHLATAVNAGTAGDIVYSDHDCLGPDGHRRNPFFKPDWSPDLFLAQMYLGHFVAIRRELLLQVGGLRSGCDGSQDYDLALRCIAAGARVTHIPHVLYHWRQHPDSTAANPGSKPYAHEAGRKAIQHHLDALSPGAVAGDGEHLFTYDVRYPLPTPAPRAAILIPTRDRVDLLAACLDSIFERTAYANYEVIVIDNDSVEPQTQQYFAEACAAHPNLRVLPAPVPFNWSHLNNLGAAAVEADVLVFLNNDTVVISPDWLQRLAENALRPQVGVCAPLLLYEDGTIQHAGVVVGMGGWADHVYKGDPPQHRQDLFVSPMLRRNVLAVTGACMAVAADKFRELGGFDEEFIVCGSDVDLCLRACRNGLRNVYLPEARLYHYESKTRDPRAIPEVDFVRSAASYGDYRTVGDPLYNRNLDPMRSSPHLNPPARSPA
jgi:GT2 family glycosyltransferase